DDPVLTTKDAGSAEAGPKEEQPGRPGGGGGALAADLRAFEEASLSGKADAYVGRVAPTRLGAWRRGSEAGDPAGLFLYARCLMSGVGVKQDEAEAARLFREAA